MNPQESLIGDLLSMDIGGGAASSSGPAPAPASNLDLLAGGLDILVSYIYCCFTE